MISGSVVEVTMSEATMHLRTSCGTPKTLFKFQILQFLVYFARYGTPGY